MDKLTFIDKPCLKNDSKVYPFVFPNNLKDTAKFICLKRRISLAEFVREAVELHIKKYQKIIS